ncbi:MAG: DUF192 domain-containing protein [Deltaproteobacteria bacterium]|nr:DUF192 domain-containing protein [Deltaproteobacteria bacterium]MBI3077497.1 DUF192 domain-containing protein [Deltaproteobacteria bacterium]
MNAASGGEVQLGHGRIAVGLALFLGLWAASGPTAVGATLKRGVVEIRGTAIEVEIVDTPEARARGLSGRDRLGSRQGMLFLFEEPDLHTFWMKDMRFALDFIWIREGRIVDLTQNVPPPRPGETLRTYTPGQRADTVLEMTAGSVRRLGLRVGDAVRLRP